MSDPEPRDGREAAPEPMLPLISRIRQILSFKSDANGDCERFPALAAVSSQELEQIGTLLFQLVHRALRGRLVRTPAQEAGAVPKTILRGVIVTNLHDELRLNGLPFARFSLAPATSAARSAACEARSFIERFKFLRYAFSIQSRDRGSEADVIEKALCIVKS